MCDKMPEWEPLPDSRPSLPYVLMAVVVATVITVMSYVLLKRVSG